MVNEQFRQILAGADHLDCPPHELRLLARQPKALRRREQRGKEAHHVRAGPLGNLGLTHQPRQIGRLRVEELKRRAVRVGTVVQGQSGKRPQAEGFCRFSFGARMNHPLVDLVHLGKRLLHQAQKHRTGPFLWHWTALRAARAVGTGVDPHASRQAIECVGVRRQAMSLLAHIKLDAVLELAQELVGVGQRRIIAVRKQALVVQLAQATQRAAGTDPGIVAPVQALQALAQELDVADAAPVQFHVNGGTAALPQLP